MERQEVFSSVVEILKPYARDEQALSSVTEASDILKELQVNSSRLVDIILAFEDKFDIEVDDSEADKVATVGDAVEMITTKL